MSPSFGLPALQAVFALLLSEGGEHVEKFLGLPMWVWQLANLALFLGVLGYFVARPLAEAFRKRQEEIEERRRQAEKQRAEVERLTSEIGQRVRKLESDIEEVRREGRAEGERERAALLERANREGKRVREEAEAEIGRRLASAKEQLRQTAADLMANAALDLVSRDITEEDRRRLLSESVAKVKGAR